MDNLLNHLSWNITKKKWLTLLLPYVKFTLFTGTQVEVVFSTNLLLNDCCTWSPFTLKFESDYEHFKSWALNDIRNYLTY